VNLPIEAPTGRIVVGVDGSEASYRALEVGVALARVMARPVLALTAWRLPIVSTPYPISVDPRELEEPARCALERAVAAVRTDDVEIATLLVNDDARDALLAHVEPDDLLIVGRRGHGGIIGLVMGSVATWCVGHARGAVLVVPTDCRLASAPPA
jgi:nucleotide-binding universal stress UspA family protein